jgi:hypothetical protein
MLSLDTSPSTQRNRCVYPEHFRQVSLCPATLISLSVAYGRGEQARWSGAPRMHHAAEQGSAAGCSRNGCVIQPSRPLQGAEDRAIEPPYHSAGRHGVAVYRFLQCRQAGPRAVFGSSRAGQPQQIQQTGILACCRLLVAVPIAKCRTRGDTNASSAYRRQSDLCARRRRRH